MMRLLKMHNFFKMQAGRDINKNKNIEKINTMNIFKLYGVTLIFCLFTAIGFAQNKQVTGTVKDGSGPIPGATILEKDVAGNGTVSDANGAFRVSLKGDSRILIIKSVGYVAQEVKIPASNFVTVTLVSNQTALEDVVVVGFAQQKKVTLTGSVSAVSGKELRSNPSASLQNTLSGKVSGFFSQQRLGQPGADGAAFFIRGINSINGDSQPLIVIDDIESTYVQFSKLDANEVESVTILKDASTTAIYGVKGANGVVLVTTRRGVTGKPAISVRMEYGLSEPTILPTYLDSYNTALLYNQAQLNDYNNLNPASSTPFVPKFSANDLALYQNGQDPYGHPNVNWRDELFRKFSNQQRTNLDVSGGTEKVKYFVSLGFVNQGGITKDYSEGQGINGNYYYRRYNYRSNMDIAVNKTLNLKVDLAGNIGEVNTPYVFYPTGINGARNDVFYDFSNYFSLAPYAYPIKNPNGSWGYSANQVNNGYNGNNIIERLSLGGYTRTYENNMTFSSSAIQDLNFITKGLSAKATVAYSSSYIYGRSQTRSAYPSFIYDPVANTYTPRDANTYKIDKFNLGYTPGSTIRQISLQGFLNYDRKFNDHHVSGVALFTRSSLTKYIDATSGNNATSLTSTTPTGTNPDQTYNFIPNNFQGLTARLNYDYKQKYLLTISGAYNGSDRFVSTKRFGFFPAVSVGWNIAEESIVKENLPFLNLFKVRGAYGIVGSDKIGNSFSYAYLQSYAINNGIQQASFGTTSNLFNGIQEGTLPNSNVTWEKEKKLDIGVDFALFNSKLTGLAGYFNNNRYDELISRGTVSTIFGQSLPPANLGRTNNRGLEFELAYRDVIGKDFTYSIRSTFSYAHNNVIFIDEATPPYAYQAQSGHSIGTPYVYVWNGRYFRDQADIAATPHLNGVRPGDLVFADLNSDGIIDGNDKQFYGKPNLPEKNYGIQFSFGYKGLTIAASFQAATDFNLSAFSEAIKPFTANLQPIHQQAWTPALGDNAKYQGLSLSATVSDPGTNNSSFYTVSGNYLRLKTAEVRYALPTSWLKKLRIRDASIYMNGYNLLTWSKAFSLYALDPEVISGTDRVYYPPERTYNFGLSVTF